MAEAAGQPARNIQRQILVARWRKAEFCFPTSHYVKSGFGVVHNYMLPELAAFVKLDVSTFR